MPLRPTMSLIIDQVRTKIGDPKGARQQFDDSTIQDALDRYRDDIRYEPLKTAPSFVNTSGGPQAQYVFADYYSRFSFWESDVIIQGNDVNTHAPWVVLTPLSSELLVGHFQFELDVFHTGTFPGQWPPVYATGKTFDIFAASADLLEMWALALSGKYDVSVAGQSFRRSQMMEFKLKMANQYRMMAKTRVGKMVRKDVRARETLHGDTTFI